MMRSRSILVVDDNPTNLKVLLEVLETSGFKVIVARSGESALNKLKRNLPDLIVLDVMMPGIDGFETCRQLKANEITKNIPIIFMTALSDVVDKVKGLKLGAVDYITKPFEHEEVLARINVHLKLRAAQLQLLQQDKMSSLGELMAGVAHEINNPMNFIANNLTYAADYLQDLLQHLQLYQQQFPDPGDNITDHAASIELDYLRKDFPKLLKSMQEGTKRISNISTSLRTFSRVDTADKTAFDLHSGLNSTLLILKHRLKAREERPAIQVVQHYGELPLVQCYPGQLNQVFMNLLANAIDALEDANQGRSYTELEADPNRITISTEVSLTRRQVVLSIRDNGAGIPAAVQERIFETSFTTKAVGKGTGLGLAIAREIIEAKHGGAIAVNSQLERGTEFLIYLPLDA